MKMWNDSQVILVALFETQLQSLYSALTLFRRPDVSVSGHLLWDNGKDVSVLKNPSQFSLGSVLSPDLNQSLSLQIGPQDIPRSLKGNDIF